MALTRVPTLADRLGRDLPVAWDGEPIRWGEPMAYGAIFVCPPPRVPDACTSCGALAADGADLYTGRLRGPDQEPYWTRDSFGRAVKKPGWEVWLPRLLLRRCLSCGHDQVSDLESGEVWDLDPSDYGETGSWAEEPTLF